MLRTSWRSWRRAAMMLRARSNAQVATGIYAYKETEPAVDNDNAPSAADSTPSRKPIRRLRSLAKATDASAVAQSSPTEAAADSSAAMSTSAPEASSPASTPAFNQSAINAVVGRLNKKLGRNTVLMMNESADTYDELERISTGCLTLDLVLGGGIPRGRIVEIFGPESCGKTTLALSIMAQAQKQGLPVALLDVECAYDKAYGEKMGLSSDGFMFGQPDCGEDAFEILNELCCEGIFGVVVVDSVAALVPRSDFERDMGDPQMGTHAKLMSSCLRRCASVASKSKTTVIFINQLRNKIGVIYGNPEVTSGGSALKYYASQRIDVRKNKILEGDEKEGPSRGLRVKAKVVKNKVGKPQGVAYFEILYDHGLDQVGTLIDCAIKLKVIDKRGSHLYFTEDGEELKLGQGRDKAIAFLHAPENAGVKERLEACIKENWRDGLMDNLDSDVEEAEF